MELLYQTRGDSSPHGRPGVYLTGHPEDLRRCAGEVANEILALQPCVIYRSARPEEEISPEEAAEGLEPMQLLVLLVTGRLLREPSRAMDVEFPAARAGHIPVLPLLMEPGLEEAFDRACGNLQGLARYQRGRISGGEPGPGTPLARGWFGDTYEDQLKNFLDRVLVGEALTEEVRRAFLARFFLSYRKKDRKRIYDLIRLIHSRDDWQDVAIWYDELLTPGEYFDAEIDAELRKSDLVLLAVTPHVLEGGNYVKDIEYPAALEAGKPVVPVELAPTDRAALEEAFRGLPPCADIREEGALFRSLEELTGGAVTPEGIGDRAAHDFAMGLAYLCGIDVEVDRARGAARITRAAEAGHPGAIQQLVQMYQTGNGVPRNQRIGLKWQSRLAGVWEARFAESGQPSDCCAWLWSWRAVGDGRRKLMEYAEAERIYLQVFDAAERARARFPEDPELLRILSRCCTDLGNLCAHAGSAGEKTDYLEEQERWQRRGAEFMEQLCQRSGAPEDWQMLALTLKDLGLSWKRRGQLDRAQEAMEGCLEILCSDRSGPGTADLTMCLAIVCHGLGDVCRAKGALAQAEGWYQRALELTESLAGELEDQEYFEMLAALTGSLGAVCQRAGRTEEAEGWYRRRLELCAELYEESLLPDNCSALISALSDLGALQESAGGYGKAADLRRAELKYRRQLLKELPQAARPRQILRLARCYSQLGVDELCVKEPAAAEEHCRRAAALCRAQYEETGAPEAKYELSSSLCWLGFCLRAVGREGEAADCYDQALALCLALRRERRQPEDRDLEGRICAELAQCAGLEPGRRYAACVRARDYYARLCEVYPDDGNCLADRNYFQDLLEKLREAGGGE